MQPFVVNEENKRMVTNNITCLLRSFLDNSGFQNILFCWVLQEDAIWQGIAANLPLQNVAVHRITLTVSEQALRLRLQRDGTPGCVRRMLSNAVWRGFRCTTGSAR